MNQLASSLAGAVAVGAGAVTVALVLVVGAIARGAPTARTPAVRRSEPAEDVPDGTATRRRVVRWLGAASGFALAFVLAGPVGAVAGAGAVVVVGHRGRARREAADRRRVEAELPDAIELLVLCVHAGRSPAQAVGELSQRAPPSVRPGFAAVERQLHRGHLLADALGELPIVLGPAARELAAAVATAEREGLPLAPMLDRLASEARATRRRHGEAAARRLPVQLSFPLVVCVLPSFVLVALAPAVLGALSTLRGTAP